MLIDAMTQRDALILFFRIPQIERGGPDNPFASVAWDDFNALYSAMFGDLFRISCQLPDVDILVYRNTEEISDDFFLPFRKKIRLFPLNESSISDQMQQALMDAFQNKYQKVVLFLDNNPLLSRAIIRKVFDQLGYEDDCIVVGPTFDGKCYLIGMKTYHDSILKSEEGDTLHKANILMKNICRTSAVIFPLEPVLSCDVSANLIELRRKMETMNKGSIEFPSKTHEIFRMFDKKYKLRKYLQ
jgi:hypothetical protein